MELIDTSFEEKAPRKSVSGLISLAYRRLSDMIREPGWADGGRLPSEERLTRSLGISRRVLREALTLLRAEGRIVSRRGSGNYVVPREDTASGAIDFGVLAIRSMADVEACLRFRCAIEVAAAGAAAEHRDDADISRLEDALEVYRHRLPGAAQFEADYGFHLLLARASGNKFFAAALEGLKPTLRISYDFGRRMRQVPLNESTRVAFEHHRVLDAVRERDPDAAREAMEAHLGAGIQRLFGKSK